MHGDGDPPLSPSVVALVDLARSPETATRYRSQRAAPAGVGRLSDVTNGTTRRAGELFCVFFAPGPPQSATCFS